MNQKLRFLCSLLLKEFFWRAWRLGAIKNELYGLLRVIEVSDLFDNIALLLLGQLRIYGERQ